MRSGSIYEVADVLKSLTFLAKSKSLSFREKRMLDRAKFLIISEVSEVMRETAAGDRRPRRPRARALLHRQGAAPPRRAPARRLRKRHRVRWQPPRRPVAPHARRKSVQSQLASRTVKSPPDESFDGLFVYDSRRVLIAAVRSLATYVAVSLYVLIAAPARDADRDPVRREEAPLRARSLGVQLALALERHHAFGSPAASTCRSIGPPSSAPIIRATSIRRFCSTRSTRACTSSTRRRLRRHPAARARVPSTAASFRSIVATRKRRCDRSRPARSRSGRQLVPDLSGGHAQQDRRAAAVQERRLHHGDQGAGADRAGRRAGRRRRDAARAARSSGRPRSASGSASRSRRQGWRSGIATR